MLGWLQDRGNRADAEDFEEHGEVGCPSRGSAMPPSAAGHGQRDHGEYGGPDGGAGGASAAGGPARFGRGLPRQGRHCTPPGRGAVSLCPLPACLLRAGDAQHSDLLDLGKPGKQPMQGRILLLARTIRAPAGLQTRVPAVTVMERSYCNAYYAFQARTTR
jgi:hypothetical protein